MGSHFVHVCSIDQGRIKTALGSKDQGILSKWLSAIRKNGNDWPEETRLECEEAARRMIAGDYSADECEDGHAFGYALQEYCRDWSAAQAVLECYVDVDWPQFWEFVVEGKGPQLEIPTSSSGVPTVNLHVGSEIARHRKAFALVNPGDGEFENFGGTSQNLTELDKVLADAENSGRVVVVFWTV